MSNSIKKGKHRSFDKEIKRWYETTLTTHKKLIKRLVVGRCENCRHNYTPGSIKFKKVTTTGMMLRGYGGTGVVDLWIYCDLKYIDYLKEKLER